MKKIINIIILLSVVLSFPVFIYAYDNNLYDISQYESYSDLTELETNKKYNYDIDYNTYEEKYCFGNSNKIETKVFPYDYNKKNNVNAYYIFDNDICQDFIKNPSEKNLLDLSNKPINQVAKYNLYTVNYIDGTTDVHTVLLSDSRYYITISNFSPNTVDKDFFVNEVNLEFINNDNLEKMLLEKGINEKIVDKAIIWNKNYPTMLWIKTQQDIYFWIYSGINYDNLQIGENANSINYTLYNKKEFSKKIIQAYCKIIVNNKEYDDNESLISYGDFFFIKEKAFLECLGAKNINRNDDDTLTFNLNGEKIQHFKTVVRENVSNAYGRYIINGHLAYDKNGKQIVFPFFFNGVSKYDYDWENLQLYKIDNEYYYAGNSIKYVLSKYNKEFILDANNKIFIIRDIKNRA